MMIGLGVLTLGNSGCNSAFRADRDGSPTDDGGNPTVDAPPGLPGAVDILFVVDNSGSMAQEQAALAAGMPGFISALESAVGKRPSLHIGVISTNLGAGPFVIQSCSMDGDRGELQNAPRVANCIPPTDKFIRDEAEDGGGRSINYPQGQLSETFSCISQLGTLGCGFEQPLEAVRRALDPVLTPANAGFLREGALLAVIFVTDEDDCSAKDVRLFDTAQTTIESELGPLSSYRCFEFGVVCEPDSRTELGARSNCRPRDPSEFLHTAQTYVDFLDSIKPRSRIVTAGIIGPVTPVSVTTNGAFDPPQPALAPSCEDAALGVGFPGVRLQAFLDAFSDQGVSGSICDPLSDSLLPIAGLIADHLPQ